MGDARLGSTILIQRFRMIGGASEGNRTAALTLEHFVLDGPVAAMLLLTAGFFLGVKNGVAAIFDALVAE